jgi:hypothetical protein
VHSDASGERNVDTQFFMLRWDPNVFYKKRDGTRYAEYVFLHPVGSAGHVVHAGASTVRNINALFIISGWDRYIFHKKRVGT